MHLIRIKITPAAGRSLLRAPLLGVSRNATKC